MKKFMKNDFVAPAALLLSVAVLVFSFARSAKLSGEIAELKDDLNQKHNALSSDLGLKIDRFDNRIFKLKEEGFVEKEEFSDFSQKVLSATALVGSAKDVASLTQSGEVVIGKEESISEGVGTGFFISSDGFIVTAKHVVDAIKDEIIMVKKLSGQTLPAEIVGTFESSDIAVLRVEGGNHQFVELGFFDNFNVGEEIGFVGFSLSTGVSRPLVHRGVVSVKGSSGNTKLFTINAFVNKGNSGGPVFSVKTGRVLGMVSARQRDESSKQFISLPPNYSSGFILGGIDPVKFNVELYNRTVQLVGDVSQVGIGIVYSADIIREFLQGR